jgi:hypothetical protein
MGDQMGEQDVQVIHAWDTERRRVLCGMPGQTRSTKDAARVTCTACRELLRRAAAAAADHAGRN